MHIVLLILKIIGIILLVVLGLFLLITVTLIFNRMKYRLEGSYSESENLHVRFSARWLFRLVAVDAEFDSEEGLTGSARIAWFHLKRKEPKTAEEEDDVGVSSTGHSNDADGMDSADSTGRSGKAQTIFQIESREEKTNPGSKKDHSGDDPVCEGEHPGTENDTGIENGTGNEKGMPGDDEVEHIGWFAKIKSRFLRLKEKFRRIKYTFQSICDKINVIREKKDEILDFLRDAENQGAFRHMFGELRHILWKIRPKKCWIRGVIGFDDPAFTGKFFGGLSILYAWVGEGMQVIPDFEENRIDLEFFMKGRIRLLYLIQAGVRILMDRQCRRFIRKVQDMFS